MSSADVRYSISPKHTLTAMLTGPLLEMGQLIPGIHDVMAEPFDITNHAGNMWVGSFVAGCAAITYNAIKEQEDVQGGIPQEAVSRFRKYGTAAICSTVAAVNCITETKWGVETFPVAEALGGTTPDVLDTAYSTAWAGLVSVGLWRRKK